MEMCVCSNTTVSIVVPCYNCETTLDITVQSIIKQDDGVYEVVLVDDGSNDGTSFLCDNYSKKHEFIKVIHKENGGLVSAWKAGINAATGKYIVFCDSDDYINQDLNGKIIPILTDLTPDLVVYGLQTEFDNGDRIVDGVALPEGYYGKDDLGKIVVPNLLSDGSMQSELLLSSRCNKVFKRKLLKRTMCDVPEEISLGEDDITCFSYVLNCNSLYVIGDYYPYHYVRHNSSMIGVYDANAFVKIEKLYDVLEKIAEKYQYKYPEQLRLDYLSTMVLFMKKEICRNPEGYHSVRNNLIRAMSSSRFYNNVNIGLIKKYSLPSKIFAMLLIKKSYFPSYIIARFIDRMRGRNV